MNKNDENQNNEIERYKFSIEALEKKNSTIKTGSLYLFY